jgi:hypothetical protein
MYWHYDSQRRIAMQRTIAGLVGFAFLVSPALAHHGWGSYDAARPMTIVATIEDASLANPHGMLMLMHEGKKWEVTLAPLSRMNARGATAEVVVIGKTVTVVS